MSLFETTVTSHGPGKSSSRSRDRSSRASSSRTPAASALAGELGGGGGGAPATLEGYLEKYTEAAGKFQRRWFVLDADSDAPALRYSGSSGKGERSSVPLERIRDIRPGFDLPTLTKAPNLEFQFTLSGSRRVLRLRAPTVTEAAAWIMALERECTPAQRRVAAARRAASGAAPPGSPRAQDDGLPSGWRSAADAHGRTFYFNKVTGERSWNHPMAPPPEMEGGPFSGAASPMQPMQQSSAGQGRPVYGREHDPPPKAKGVRSHNLIELHVHELGFFGVSLDETADPTTAKTYIRVSAVDPGSEAHRQLPQLVPGTYLHTVQGRAVGGLHPNAIVNHLKERPLTISFSFTSEEVDEAAEEQQRYGLKCPFDTTFVEPVGTPLGIRFMEYESKLGPQHYLCIEQLSEIARMTHPELRTGMILTKVNALSTARIQSTDKVKELLMQRPVRVTFTDKMADVETSRTMDVMHAAMKWKAFVRRCRRRRESGYVLGPGGVVISTPPGVPMPGTPAAAAASNGGAPQPAGSPGNDGRPPMLQVPEGEPPLDEKAAAKAAAKKKKEEAAEKKAANKAKKDEEQALAKARKEEKEQASGGGGGAKQNSEASLEAAKKKAKEKQESVSEALDAPGDALAKQKDKAKGKIKKGDPPPPEQPPPPSEAPAPAPAPEPEPEPKKKKEKKEKKKKGDASDGEKKSGGGGGGGGEITNAMLGDPPEGLSAMDKAKWKKQRRKELVAEQAK
eukprot:COSAG06_NODE_76_length_25790_cov_35.826749_4_plen_736_part_00